MEILQRNGAIGTMEAKKKYGMLPFFLIDEVLQRSELDSIRDEAPFFLSVVSRKREKFKYFIQGKNLVPISETKDLGCEPAFSCCFVVNIEVHEALQEELNRAKKWMLIFRSGKNYFLVIDFASGRILDSFITSGRLKMPHE